MKNTTMLALGALLLTQPVFSQQPAPTTFQEARIDSLAQRLVRTGKVQGVNLLFSQNGKIIYRKAFGKADENRPLQTGDIFRIASQTKAITSLAVMMLWEEGRFLLDEPVSNYIPAFANLRVIKDFNAADTTYTSVAPNRPVTVRDLLRHTSGISYPLITGDPRFQAIFAKHKVPTGIGSPGNLKNFVDQIALQPLVHNPGEAFTYGLNIDVLGRLVEIWSGQPLEVFFRERIFRPLEMNDTYFRVPDDKAKRLVPVFSATGGRLHRQTAPIYEGNDAGYPLQDGIIVSGGAGLSSTTADYAKFLQLLLDGGVYKGKRIIGNAAIRLMTTPQIPQGATAKWDWPDFSFGLGFSLVTPQNQAAGPVPEGSFFWGGAFNTHYWADPANDIVGIVFTQEYAPASYWDLGTLFKNVFYTALEKSK
ncbi:serine hydrolase domain-containing protein [Chitinophaga caseinilytica]|uniref:Serine hydrolase domain-containing protein n=1 Tax=Chitinophaga caseinilytica TaxID=2267521 RepID=A0ABZ2Z5C3_9BACT